MKLEFKKAFNTLIGKKSSSDFINELLRVGYGNADTFDKHLSEREALELYAKINAVNTSINLIADKFKTLQPVLFDKEKKEFTKSGQKGIKENEQALFDLLAEPNPDTLQDEFFKQMIAFYIATGNTYLVALGNINTAPKEMNVIPSHYVEVKGNKIDGLAYEYDISSFGKKEIFKRSKEFRFFSNGREIWHIKTFNPFMSSENLKGMPLLNPDKSQALQIKEGDSHNFNSLQNGANMGGIFTLEGMDADMLQKIQNDFNNKFAGTKNAKKVAIYDRPHNFTELGKSMKDMEFRNLLKDNETRIYNNLKIPLPLVSTDASTFNNYEEAQLKLWDNAILPLAKTMFQELSSFLISRFKIENKIITYDENKIKDLEVRRNKELTRKQKSGYYTINELRAEEGMEEVSGGDVIYQPMNLIPVGSSMPQEAKELTTKSKFTELMKMQLDCKGARKFTDKDIEDIADKEGLK